MARGTPNLIEVLKRHQERGPGAVNSYLTAVERFYGQIRRWMDPAVKQRLALVRDAGGVPISEAGVGEYHAPVLWIEIGPNRVRLVPRGIHAEPGFVGRIDLDARDRIALVVLDDDGAWKFVTRTPPSKVAIDERTFAKVLDDILGAPRARG